MNEALVLTKPEDINAYRLLAIKGTLKLESLGMRRSAGRASALSIVKNEFGIKARTAKDAFPLYCAWLKEIGVLV